MSVMASEITGISIVCSTVCSGTDQRKHQSSVSLAFVREIHWWPVDSPHKRAGYENVSIWWLHHASLRQQCIGNIVPFHLSSCGSPNRAIDGIFQAVSIFLHFVLLFILQLLILSDGALIPPFLRGDVQIAFRLKNQCISNIITDHEATLVPSWDKSVLVM